MEGRGKGGKGRGEDIEKQSENPRFIPLKLAFGLSTADQIMSNI